MVTAPTNTLGTEPCQQDDPSSRIVSDSLAMGVAFALALTVVQRGIGFLRGIVFCRLMTDQQLGQWSMAFSFLMMLAPLAVLGLPGCFGKFVEHFRHQGQARTFIRRMAVVSFGMTLLVSTLIILLPRYSAWLVLRDESQATVMVCVGIGLMAVSAMNFATSLLESLRQVRLVTIIRFVNGISFAVFGTALLCFWSDAAAAATIGFALSCGLSLIPAVWFFSRFGSAIADTGRQLGQRNMWTRIAPFAAWMWVSNLFHNLFEVSDRYMLIHWSPVKADIAQGFVGQYHSGRVLPLLMVGVATLLADLLLPYMSASWEAGKKHLARIQLYWLVKTVAIGFTVGGVMVLMLAPLLFDWVLQGRYNDGLAVLPLTLVYCIWFSLFIVGQDYLWLAEKGKLCFAAIALGLVSNIVLNIVLIPHFGLWGAVLATTIGNAVNIAMVFLFNMRVDCAPDLGCWLCVLIPLLLLFPLPNAVAILVVIGIMAQQTDWLFNSAEKQQLLQAYDTVRTRFRPN